MLVPRVQSVNRFQKPIAKRVANSNQQVSAAAKKLQQIALTSTLGAFAVSKSTDAKKVNFSDNGPDTSCDGIPWSVINIDLYNC